MSTPSPRDARDGGRDRRRASADAFEGVVVRRGETLSAFAKRTGTRAEVILLLNPHASAKGLISGMVLDVPLRATTAKTPAKTAKTAKKGRSATTKDAASASDARGRGKRGGEKTTTTTTTTSFSGKLYEKSYPVLEQRSKELQAELRARVEEFGVAAKGEKAAALAGELVGKSRDKLSAWRKKMMSVVAKTTDEAAENFGARFENFKSRAVAKKPSEAAKDKRQREKGARRDGGQG